VVQAYVMVMDAIAVLLLIALAAGLARIALRCHRGPFRTVSAGGGGMFLLLAISSLHHLLILAAGKNLITSHWLDWLQGPLAVIQSTLAVLAGTCGVVLALRYWNHLERAALMVNVLTDQLPAGARAKQARLTAREQEVLDLLRKGILSDAEIGRTLHISAATAATHVQHILRKTELHSRRDLMLLPRPTSVG
jgi:DNA-binding CsgD family transcriptional regulator